MDQVVASLVTLAAMSSSGTQPRPQIIDVGGTKLEVPIPKGYCIPTGEGADVIKFQTKLDDRNATLLVLVDCRHDRAMENYLEIKAPLRMLTSDVGRDEALERLRSEGFNDPDFQKHLEAGDFEKHTSDRTYEVTGQTVTFDGIIKPRGVDQTCAYLGGNSTVTGPKKSRTMAAASCITAVGKRLITLNAYTVATSARSFETLYKPLRDWALTIKPAPQ